MLILEDLAGGTPLDHVEPRQGSCNQRVAHGMANVPWIAVHQIEPSAGMSARSSPELILWLPIVVMVNFSSAGVARARAVSRHCQQRRMSACSEMQCPQSETADQLTTNLLRRCRAAMKDPRIVDDDHLPWLHGHDLPAVLMRVDHGDDLGSSQ